MPQTSLYVFSHLPEGFVPAGLLTLTEENNDVVASSFAYGTRYLNRHQRFELDPVSLAIPSTEAIAGLALFPARQLKLFGGLRDAAPDAWGRRVIEARHKVPVNSLPESVYLLEAGSERVGALDVRLSLTSAPHGAASEVTSLSYLLETAQRIESGETAPARMSDLFGSGAGAGGARPKATVRDEAGLLWLAKFPSISDTIDMATAECLTLQLAQRCGITVPVVKVVTLGSKPVFLVRRFDRYWCSAGQVPITRSPLHETLPATDLTEHRLPFVSGLTMVACDEFEARLRSYADLANALRRRVHASCVKDDLIELFTRMVFNIFVSNDDDHLRNHGFVRDPRLPGWRLSPLYDVVPRPALARERYLHLEVGEQGKFASLDNALSRYTVFTPHRAEAVAAIARVWGEIKQWKPHFEAMGAIGALIDRIDSAFRNLDDIATPGLCAEVRLTASRSAHY